MNTDIDASLKNYLSNNPKLQHYASSPFFHHNADAPSLLAEISIHGLSDKVLCAIKEFFVNLSSEEITEYINRTNRTGENIFFFCKDFELTKIMIEYALDINTCSNNGISALTRMCNYYSYGGRLDNDAITKLAPDNAKIIELLLDNGADINATDRIGQTPLMYYCAGYCPTQTFSNNNFESIVELLIYRGADVLAKTCRGLRAWELVRDRTLVSEELLQLLKGNVRINNTKSAAKI